MRRLTLPAVIVTAQSGVENRLPPSVYFPFYPRSIYLFLGVIAMRRLIPFLSVGLVCLGLFLVHARQWPAAGHQPDANRDQRRYRRPAADIDTATHSDGDCSSDIIRRCSPTTAVNLYPGAETCPVTQTPVPVVLVPAPPVMTATPYSAGCSRLPASVATLTQGPCRTRRWLYRRHRAPAPGRRTTAAGACMFELTFFLDKNSDNRAGLGEGVPGMRVCFLNPRGELLAFLTTNEYGTVTWATAQRVKTILAPAYTALEQARRCR